VKIVQSFWSCHETNLLKFKAGWISPEYNLMSWALSCLQLKQSYPEVTLHADNVSAKMLIDTLRLPYDKVTCDLNCLDKYHPQLWALPKIHTYSKQQNPFLHVDGDVFIWNQFDEELLQSKLIAQNEESATVYYENILQSLEKELSYFPTEIVAERKLENPIHAFNAGILGGHDIEFFQEYTSKAFKFVDKNIQSLSKINVSNFNIFFEQYLFYCLIRRQNKQVNVLISEVVSDNEYTDLGEFIDVPHSKHYLHLLGNYKRNEKICIQMAHRLREDYPEHYYRIIEVFKANKVPLLNNYYWFESDIDKQNLLVKHHSLKRLYLADELLKTETSQLLATSLPKYIFYRIQILKNFIESISQNQSLRVFSEKLSQYTQDIAKFEEALSALATQKFNTISKNYLLGRDIASVQYAEKTFGRFELVLEKIIEKDSAIQIVESQFDWTILDNPEYLYTNAPKLLDQEPSEVYTLVVPECNEKGYSLVNIDRLDILILSIIEERKTIAVLLEQLKSSFDPNDLQDSKAEFEKLIFGRIKNGLQNKSIKAILPASA
jgi:hypothetical protein